MLQGISAIAFDLDGTLYPNYSLNIRLLPFILKHLPLVVALGKARNTIRSEQEKDPESFMPDFYDYQARLIAMQLKAEPEQIRERLDDLIYRGWERHFSKIRLFPYLREFLVELRTTPLKLGLLSDFPPQNKLEQLGIAGCWDAIICSEDTGALKPAARPFTELAKALNCTAKQILYVGNSSRYDVAGAARTGMKSALLANRFASKCAARTASTGATRGATADFTFYDYRQLRDFVLL